MSEYRPQQESGTAAGTAKIIQVGVIAATLLMTPLAATTQGSPFAKPLRNYPPFKIEETPKTFGQLANIFSGEYERAPFNFELEVAAFYSKLLVAQEPLGKEFERVLYDNLSSLYVRT